ncbi:MAG TPA: hypothetical protein VHX38_35945 [Pseudonocardiaceae bacterium]|nr:hypothetical protein [Pseudonocardiaceae bacterium]
MRIMVLTDAVELHCHGTEIELDAACLDRLIDCGEQAVPQLSGHSDTVFGDRAVSTWVEWNSRTSLDWSIKGGTLEMHWGQHVVTVTGAALAPLIERARRARTELDQRRSTPCDDALPALVIPAVPMPGAATIDDLEKILRGNGYGCDDAARLLRRYCAPNLRDVVGQLEKWANQIRPHLTAPET